MKREGRDRGGRFARGNRGGPGRPKRATEAEYLEALAHIVSLDDLRAIARRAVADAKKGSARARDWVSTYLLGVPALKAPRRPDDRQRAMIEAVRDELFPGLAAAGPAGDPPKPKRIPPRKDPNRTGPATPLPLPTENP